MRSLAKVMLGALVVILVPAPATSPRGGPRVPASITVQAGNLTYRIDRTGHVGRSRPVRWPYPKDAACCAAPGVWFAVRHRHLVVGAGGRALWRSYREFARRFTLGAVRVGAQVVVFTYGNHLYLAPLDGAERAIGRAELPVGFTDGGLYTYQWGGELLLRSDSGQVLKTIGRPSGRSNYAVMGASLYFLARGTVMEARGATVSELVGLADLGLSSRSLWLQSTGSLLELQNARRLVLLRGDGSVFASTPLPRAQGQSGSISSLISLNAGADAVAFVADFTRGQSSYGTETVYLLRAGTRVAAPVHTASVNLGGCVRWATAQWHGRWLLYSDTAGELAVIDTTGSHPAIDLSHLARRLTGSGATLNAYWSGQPPTM